MNTAANINPVSGTASGAKVAHIFREHGLKFSKRRVSTEDEDNLRAIVLRRFVLEQEKNKLAIPRELSQKLSVYKKRASVATDPKTKERNLAKVVELENKIAQFGGRKRKGREASLIEASWSITMFPPKQAMQYDPNIHIRLQKVVEEIHKKYFPSISIEDVGIAAHIDQATIHLHTCFNVPPGTTYTAILNNTKAEMIEKEELEEGESLYAKLQQDFNNAVRVEFPDLKIEKISGVKKDYLELKDYKKVPQVVEVEVVKEVEVIKEVEVEKIVEKEVIKEVEVEKVVEVVDNTKILELQEALESTKSLLVETQSALSLETQKKDRYADNNATVEKFFSEKGFSANPGEGFWSFLKRLFVELVTKVGDLTRENAQLKRERDLAQLVQSSAALPFDEDVDKVVSTSEKPATDLNQWLLDNKRESERTLK